MKLDFVGVGPQRAGTSWLHRNFMNHSEVCLPREPIKETFFFDEQYHRGLSWYRKYFPADCDRFTGVIGEFGPSYFDVEQAPRRICGENPDCKIIVSIRNPVDRTFSLFLHYLKLGEVPPDFDKAIEQMPRIITSGNYKLHILRWVELFRFDRVHFVLLDDIKEHPLQTLNEVCKFLGISDFLPEQIITRPVNIAFLPKYLWISRVRNIIVRVAQEHHRYGILSLGRKVSHFLLPWIRAGIPTENHPVLSTEQRKTLYELYTEDIVFLEQLLQRSLDSWRPESEKHFKS
jgi:hypothetical protein